MADPDQFTSVFAKYERQLYGFTALSCQFGRFLNRAALVTVFLSFDSFLDRQALQ